MVFVFGRALEPQQVFDRKEIVERLAERTAGIKKGIRRDYALVGPRRVGKTTIIKKVLQNAEKKHLNAMLFDCQGLDFGFEALDTMLFIKLYGAMAAQKFLEKKGIKEKIIEGMKEVPSKTVLFLSEIFGKVRGLKIDFLNDWFDIAIEFEKNKLSDDALVSYFEKTINLPEMLAKKSNSHWVVAFDEFQLLAGLKISGKKSVIPLLRKNFEKHKRVSYIISGSNVGLMQDLILDLKNPFGANFFVEWVGLFEPGTAKEFLIKNFKEEKIKIDSKAVDEIVRFTGGHPAYLNWFGEKCIQKKTVYFKHIKEIEKEIFQPYNLGYLFEREISRLKRVKALSKTYKVLQAMAKYDLVSPSQISKTIEVKQSDVVNYLNRLKLYGYIIKIKEGHYEILDKMLAKYLSAQI